MQLQEAIVSIQHTRNHAKAFTSSEDAMRYFLWHKDQQAVCDCRTAVFRLAET